MDNNKSKVIIIDNNISTGMYLSGCCRAVMPKSGITWLRISDDTGYFSGMFPEGVEHQVKTSLADGAKLIHDRTITTDELIIFYNLRLSPYQGTSDSAVDSPITTVVKRLVGSNRRILVNVHSSELSTRELAEAIDPLFKTKPRKAKVICHHLITGSPPPTILEIVRETLAEWKRRNPENGKQTMEATS